MTTRLRMIGVGVAAALVAAAVPVFASGAGPASAANTSAALSRSVVVVCPTGAARHRGWLRIERGGRGHGRRLHGCRCLTATGATGQTGSWGRVDCNPCPAGGATGSTGSTTAGRIHTAHPLFRRWRRIVRHALCNPCPTGGSTGSTGSTLSRPTTVMCTPCPIGGSTGSSGSTGSTSIPVLRIHRWFDCPGPPCPPNSGATGNTSPVTAWMDCRPCPAPMTPMGGIRHGGIAAIWCHPCPSTGSSGTSGTTGTHPTIDGGYPTTILGCVCAFVRAQWTGSTGASGPAACEPPPCPEPMAAAGHGGMWRSCCVQMGATGTTSGQCSPPPPICEMWGSAGATGATGSTTGGGYPCPGPPKPCMSTSAGTGNRSAMWCGPCTTPQSSSSVRGGAYVCPMVAPRPGASLSA